MPPPKSNTGVVVALSLVGVLIVAAGLIGVIGLGGNDPYDDNGYSAPTYSPGTYTSYSSPYTSSTYEYTTTRTTRTTTTTTEDTTTTDYTTTTTTPAGPQPVYVLEDNPLHYDNGTNDTSCKFLAWPSNPKASEAFFRALMPCMDAAWAPMMERAGLPYTSPNLKFPSGTSWDSPCGTVARSAAAAFYCPQDATIYMPFAGLQTTEIGNRPGQYLALFGHEFGHHIQALSGIWSKYWDVRYDAGDQTAAGLELGRRAELQANCLGGMWFAGAWNGDTGVPDAYIRQFIEDGYWRGDHPGEVRDHGSPQNAGAWQEHGYRKNRGNACNTWAAGSKHVS